MTKKALTLIGALFFLASFNAWSQNKQAEDLRVSLNIEEPNRVLEMKVNGIVLPWSPGAESNTSTLQLFLKTDPSQKEFLAKYKNLFCLQKGKNVLEIRFKEPVRKDGLPLALELFSDRKQFPDHPKLAWKAPEKKGGKEQLSFTLP